MVINALLYALLIYIFTLSLKGKKNKKSSNDAGFRFHLAIFSSHDAKVSGIGFQSGLSSVSYTFIYPGIRAQLTENQGTGGLQTEHGGL